MAKQKVTKEKVIARLVKWGWNLECATSMVEEHFEYTKKYYSDSTVSEVADVISTLCC